MKTSISSVIDSILDTLLCIRYYALGFNHIKFKSGGEAVCFNLLPKRLSDNFKTSSEKNLTLQNRDHHGQSTCFFHCPSLFNAEYRWASWLPHPISLPAYIEWVHFLVSSLWDSQIRSFAEKFVSLSDQWNFLSIVVNCNKLFCFLETEQIFNDSFSDCFYSNYCFKILYRF